MEEGLVPLRWALGFVMLFVAAVLDIRTRRVPNRYWVPFLVLGALLWIPDLVVDARGTALGALIAVLLCATFYALWYFGLLFGGADAKALMVLAVLVPWNPSDAGPSFLVPALDALANALVLTLVIPLGLLVWNLAHGRIAGIATFTAYPMDRDRARSRFVWPLERVAEDGTIRRRNLQRRGEDLATVYDALEANGVDTVWATPKVPFLVPVALGFFVAALWGNLILWAMQAMLA